jgi:hypothetical protein
MREFKRQHTTQHHLLRFGGLLLGVCALFLVTTAAVRAAWGMYGKFVEASHASNAAKQELVSLENRESIVSAALLSLLSERGMESQVRERFGVARPGEGEIHIVRDTSENAAAPAAQEENILMRLFHSLIVW